MLRTFLLVLLCCCAGVAHAATILVFGDSVSSGYGLPQNTGWARLLERRLEQEKYDYRVANASLTGETTVGGRSRISAALKEHKPQIVILELGGNDGLRGARIDTIHNNLDAIISAATARGAKVLLVGMQLPPNYGSAYVEKFQAIYPALARTRRVPLVTSIFDGFATDRGAFQSDGIHPNGPAQQRMLDNVWPVLRPMLSATAKR